VIGPPGELYSETNDNSVAILLTHGMARVLLAGDAKRGRAQASGSYTGIKMVVNVPKLQNIPSCASAPG
jgi:beta-lactamase superfamily II metal-dependent hydrolase